MKKVNQLSMSITVFALAVTALTMSCSKEKVANEQLASNAALTTTVSNMEAAYKTANTYNDSLKMCHNDSTKMNMMNYYDNKYHQYDSVYSNNHAMCKQQMESMMSGGNMNNMMGSGSTSGMMGNSNMSSMMNGQMMDMKMCDAKMDSLHTSHASYHPQTTK